MRRRHGFFGIQTKIEPIRAPKRIDMGEVVGGGCAIADIHSACGHSGVRFCDDAWPIHSFHAA
jgi:hypothetical protein